MPEFVSQEYEIAPLSSLQKHPRNANQGDFGAIKQSVDKNGFYGAIYAQRGTGYILAGNHRYDVLKSEGAKEAPVIWLDVGEVEAARILLADNRTTRLGDDDPAKLAALLKDIQAESGTLEGTGYDGDALDDLLAELGKLPGVGEQKEPESKIDRAEEYQSKWQVQRGQVWEIPSLAFPGKSHRLMCGDSEKREDVTLLLRGQKPLLMATDPPYGVNYDSEWRADYDDQRAGRSVESTVRGSIQNDDRADWRSVWKLWNPQVLYVWHAGVLAPEVAGGMKAADYEIRSQIIWAKKVMILSRGAYHWKHEPCWYSVRKGANANWQGDRTQTTLWECGDLSGSGGTSDSADEFKAGHISQKPVELFRKPIENHTQRGDLVVEPFSGSGSQFVAAEQTGRICYGMELEPKFVAAILERMSDMGLTPVLVEN